MKKEKIVVKIHQNPKLSVRMRKPMIIEEDRLRLMTSNKAQKLNSDRKSLIKQIREDKYDMNGDISLTDSVSNISSEIEEEEDRAPPIQKFPIKKT